MVTVDLPPSLPVAGIKWFDGEAENKFAAVTMEGFSFCVLVEEAFNDSKLVLQDGIRGLLEQLKSAELLYPIEIYNNSDIADKAKIVNPNATAEKQIWRRYFKPRFSGLASSPNGLILASNYWYWLAYNY